MTNTRNRGLKALGTINCLRQGTREETAMKKIGALGAGFMLATGMIASPVFGQDAISDGVVKIGVLTDMSGAYAGNVGPGSVLATKLAIEEFDGKVLDRKSTRLNSSHVKISYAV